MRAGKHSEFKLPCGCVISVDTYVRSCEPHETEFAERHEQARRDHQREQDCKDYDLNNWVRE
jgi:hypothetical protein